MKLSRGLESLLVATALGLGSGITQASFIDITSDNAKYTLTWTNSGTGLYTFTYTADFTGYTGSAATDNDYPMAISIATQPGDVDWDAGTITQAPGDTSLWSIYKGVVANSNGCPMGGTASKDWCIGLNSKTLAGDKISSLNPVLVWEFTMKLTSGVLDSDGDPAWSYKFITTDGTWKTHPTDSTKDSWNFGNYQISSTFKVPSTPRDEPPPPTNVPLPGTLVLLGLGLTGMGFQRRSRR